MSLVSFRERHSIVTELHKTLQAVMERDPSEHAPQRAIDEMRAIVDETCATMQREIYGIKSEPFVHPMPGPAALPPAPTNGAHPAAHLVNGGPHPLAPAQLQLPSPAVTQQGDRERDHERQPTVDREEGEWSRQQTPRSVAGATGTYASAQGQQPFVSPALAQRVMAITASTPSTSTILDQHQSPPFQIAAAPYASASTQAYAPPPSQQNPLYASKAPQQTHSYMQAVEPAPARLYAPTPIRALPPPPAPAQQRSEFQTIPAVARLTKETLVDIFEHLLPPARHALRGRFTNLILASGVCKQWRSLALTPRLWTVLSSLTVGEMEQLETLLARSGSGQVQLVSLHFVTPRKFQFASVCAALARGVPRIIRMELSMNEKQAPVLNALRAALIRARAPLLEHFSLDYPVRLVLSSQLFDRQAPRLTSFSCLFGQLPNWTAAGSTAICDAIRGVRVFEALDVDRPPDERDARRLLLELCPRLERLVIPIPLLNASHARWEPPVLRFLQVGEARDREAEKYMVPTLALLRHREVATVHIVAPRQDTMSYIMQRRTTVHAAALWGEHTGQLVFRDTNQHLRVFTRVAPASVGAGLRGHVLGSLAVGAWAAAADWAGLFALDLRSLTQLTVLLVAAPPGRAGLVHLFMFSSASQWHLPMLTTLRIAPAHTEPGVDLEPRLVSACEVSARDVLRFVTASMSFDALLLPEVVLAPGARFQERYSGPEVEALRRHVGNLRVLA